ncbi:MAG TPA: ketopantoate reductase C-terminal domain-containing protein, partial [Elusimicrobiota bacterium]|nr:ketopantoate reductase C-terminal domain-containing protein [Elusimicrobiota bacterium]
REDANVPAAEAARAMLARAGWDVRLRADRARMLWTKLALNAAINPLGALACVTNGALARDPALKDLLTAVCREAAAAARAAGCPLSASSLSRRVLRACRATPEQRNSTLQDLDAGRRTEIREILLPLLKAARKTGQEAPILSSLYKMTVSLETSLAGAAR